ncbi:MAG: hypothetical protein H0T53_16265 [Herpetosiphonaceae bacterium]|nr:hypothetical protein [Herpetosiphonaceae bacterium]
MSDLAAVYATLERGDRLASRQQLIEIVRSPAGQSNGEAWWLLAQSLDDPAQQADCRRRAQAAGYPPAPRATAVAQPMPAPALPPPGAGSIPAPDYSAAITFVVNKLGDDMDRYDLAQALMAREGWSYESAEGFIDYVSANFARTIAARHLTLITVISMLGLIVGLLLTCSSVLTISNVRTDGVDQIRASIRFIAGIAISGSAVWGLLKGLAALRVRR